MCSIVGGCKDLLILGVRLVGIMLRSNTTPAEACVPCCASRRAFVGGGATHLVSAWCRYTAESCDASLTTSRREDEGVDGLLRRGVNGS